MTELVNRKASSVIELEGRRAAAARRGGITPLRPLGPGTDAVQREQPVISPPRPAKRTGVYVMLLAVVAALNLVGLVMVLSASAVLSIRTYGSPWHYFVHQAMWVGLGAIVFWAALRIDYHRWRRLMAPAMAVSILGLMAVLVPGVGVKVSGASRWLGSSSL
jgi:hypothetical protein